MKSLEEWMPSGLFSEEWQLWAEASECMKRSVSAICYD